MYRFSVVVACCGFALIGSAAGQDSGQLARVHVMVVGLFHMDNPGLDLANAKVDDVLNDRRQEEIAEAVAVLKKFRPTKIAIEAPLQSPRSQQGYSDYLGGKYVLTRNEVDQIGYRLAKEAGHKKIYPVDVKGDFPFEAVKELAEKNGQEAFLNATLARAQGIVKGIEDQLGKGTVLDTLRFVNEPERVASDQMFYMDLARIATKENYAGPDLLAEWYRRNARIYANLRALIDSPEDRILVLYGSGHLFWLQRDVLDAGDLVLERLNDYR